MKEFVRVAAAVPRVRPADVTGNLESIKRVYAEAVKTGAEAVVFPELCPTGYTCADLFYQPTLLAKAEQALSDLITHIRSSLNTHTSSLIVHRSLLDTPVSPELLPANADGTVAQVTEDKVGPYELHDFFLYHFLRRGASQEKIAFLANIAFKGTYDEAFIAKWLETFFKRFYQQQFKRSCMPDGPKVGSLNLSPRGDWRMPSDAVL